ncbi:MAG: hypothetical protein A2946_00860 [Candidatus Liptonbacteria bacterium RIFCSPLOWO2_01_FULL_53_13]|uniref:Uncharacterized protein n=1 Tax=Candidatus Liptonbacteria bacterium RIFCSPLOWO2_01_FULL_53_13 TaxID=1798651 RepID=A0A1G2CGI7_9BACT|nr:MAG: hypothetical protein A2946_00860 [Candidatus Liptonbacteria bacterium RIFCSPLOWO2_01_FULL_53_13]
MLFVLAGTGLYLIPLFQPRRMGVPFLFALASGLFMPQGILGMVFLALIFFLILGIKDLAFVDRGMAYETLVFTILTALAVSLFFHAPNMEHAGIFFALGAGALFVFFLLRGFIAHEATEHASGEESRRAVIACGAAALVVWQVSAAALILPMNYFLQSALVIASAIAAVEAMRDHVLGALHRKGVVAYGGAWLAITAITLLANSWHV